MLKKKAVKVDLSYIHDDPTACPELQRGKNYVFRALPYHYIGTVLAVTKDFIILDPAVWLAESARWSDTMRAGTYNELEPYYTPCFLSRECVADVAPWLHPVPAEPK